jgi:hypothetical protein
VRDEFAQLILGHAVIQSTLQMAAELIGTLQSNQGGTRDKAAIAFRELRTFPDVAENNLFR